MANFSQRATYIVISLVGVMGGVGFGAGAYFGDRSAELADAFGASGWAYVLNQRLKN